MNQATQKTKWCGKKQVWITVFAGVMFLLSACVAAGNTNTVLPYFARVNGWDYPKMMLFTSFGGYLCVIFGVIFGQIVLRVGAKRMIVAGLIGGGLATFFFGMTNNFTVFLICIMLNFIFTAAYQSATINIIITTWFPKKKGLIFGWSTMGLVVANILWAPYITNVFDMIGRQTTMIIVTAVFFVFALLGVLFVKNTPEEAGTYPDGVEEEAGLDRAAAMEMLAYKSDWTIGRLLKAKQTWQLVFGWGLPWLAMIAFMSQLVPRLISIGYAPPFAAMFLMISSVIGLVGSWLFGVIDLRIGPKKTSVLLAIVVLVMLATGLLQRFGVAWIWIGAVAGGIATGAVANLVPSMMATWFGRWDIAAANRLINPLITLLPSVGMTLVGVFLATGLGYDKLYMLCLGLAALGLILILTVKEELIGKK